MDAMVVAAMAKWPNVPAVFGWLSLTARGEWRLKCERVAHPGLASFFARNYEHDEQGRYFVQNGPQRIFVELQLAPYAAKRQDNGWQRLPDGLSAVATAAFITPQGELLLQIETTLALVDGRDWLTLADCIVDGTGQALNEMGLAALSAGQGEALLQLPEGALKLEPAELAELLARFGIQPKPTP
jgi:hypothetical protein